MHCYRKSHVAALDGGLNPPQWQVLTDEILGKRTGKSSFLETLILWQKLLMDIYMKKH
jgi:hypothetical protein